MYFNCFRIFLDSSVEFENICTVRNEILDFIDFFLKKSE